MRSTGCDQVWFALGGLLLIGSLIQHNVKGGILIGIFVVSLLTWYHEGVQHYHLSIATVLLLLTLITLHVAPGSFPQRYPADPYLGTPARPRSQKTTLTHAPHAPPHSLPRYVQVPRLQMALSDYIDFSTFEWRKCLSAVVAFVFIGIIDVSGVVFGMAKLGDLMLADGTIPGSLYAFVGVSGGTVIGAAVGSAPVIVYVETAAGIKEGGRTGLTAVVVSIYFVLSLLLAPLFSR